MINEIQTKVDHTISQFEDVLKTKIVKPNLVFDLKGTRAGYSHFSKGLINFNLQLAVDNQSDFLEITVPHEVAHWVQRFKYGYVDYFNGRKITPHGKEWKYLMRCIGLTPNRCHSYDVSKVKTRTYKTIDFGCSCVGKVFKLTMIRYNRYLKGTPYQCPKCKSKIKPI